MLSEPHSDLKRTDNRLITAVIVAAGLYFGREVFIPLALAGLFAFLLAPSAARFEHLGLKRAPSALLAIFLFLAGLGALGWIAVGQIYNLALELPKYQQTVTTKIDSLHLNSPGRFAKTTEMLTNLKERLKSSSEEGRKAGDESEPVKAPASDRPPVPVRIEAPKESIVTTLVLRFTPLLHPLATALVVVVFLVFLLIERDDLRDRALRLSGSSRMHVTTTAIENAGLRVSRYLRKRLIVNVSFGVAAGAALWVIGVPHPLLWTFLTCLLRFVPYLGIWMAAAGPLLLAAAVSPHWGMAIETLAIFAALELIGGNFVEPLVYGASTGLSPIAILVAAIFWTVLWGFPGLLLSTPLTVCLIVIGEQVPSLRFLNVLFGEATALPPAESIYQRLLASNTRGVKAIIEELLKVKSFVELGDTTLIPTIILIEETRHADEMSSARADEILQNLDEAIEEVMSGEAEAPSVMTRPAGIVYVPARDFGDEVACRLSAQAFSAASVVQVVSHASSATEIEEVLDGIQPKAVCVIGVPPGAMRFVRMRCHQIRQRHPDVTVIAGVLTNDSDLSNLRSRIPADDAHHVVPSLQLMNEYLRSLFDSRPAQVEDKPQAEAAKKEELSESVHELQQVDVFDGPEQEMFDRFARSLARSFDAPIALIIGCAGRECFWQAQCGLPTDTMQEKSDRSLSLCSDILQCDSIHIVEDIEQDMRLANDPFLKANAIRFFAGAPLKEHDETVLGALCILDTRPRQMTEEQKEMLTSVAQQVMMAIHIHNGPLNESSRETPQSPDQPSHELLHR
jgi:predicted PurR-regulated permease PerM